MATTLKSDNTPYAVNKKEAVDEALSKLLYKTVIIQ